MIAKSGRWGHRPRRSAAVGGHQPQHGERKFHSTSSKTKELHKLI